MHSRKSGRRPRGRWVKSANHVILEFMVSTARVIEVFSSIQGEGIYVGQPHLFVRFWDCNLACQYCDTDYKGPYREYSIQELLAQVRSRIAAEGPHHAVSLTGGEPLLWWKFLRDWLPQVKALGQRIYLETNGVLHENLAQLLRWVDIIAMDVKPPSATGDRAVWREHEQFLRAARQGAAEIFVKIVVTPQTDDREMRQSAELIAAVDRKIPLVLQPVTPWGPVQETPLQDQVDRWRREASSLLTDVRVIPQVHRILGVR